MTIFFFFFFLLNHTHLQEMIFRIGLYNHISKNENVVQTKDNNNNNMNSNTNITMTHQMSNVDYTTF